MILQMPPHVFHRVEFWGIGGQTLHFDPSTGAGDKVPDQFAAMNGRSVPEDEHFAWDMALQMAEELDDLWPLDAAGVDLKEEPEQGQPPDDGKALPVKGFLEQRSLPFGRPRPDAGGPGAQPAFIDKDDQPTLAGGFFLICSHLTLRHCRMAGSSRSTARRSGRWQLKPKPPSTRQTWPG